MVETYSDSSHKFFNDLVSFFASISSLGTALDAHRVGQTKKYSSSDYITLEGASASNIEIRFFPHDLMETLLQNSWPSIIEIEKLPIASNPPYHPTWLKGLQGVTGSMIQSSFVHFFESYRSTIESTNGSNPYHWPNAWNFGRVVRNAFSHGGLLNFRNNNAVAVTWKTLSYGPTENGRQILYQDMTAVEVILLMEDMNSNL
jgi:hypothetical protein